ncbi:MAG: hypothetical protein ACLU99_00790 [Alphaproteobacteria bacterium]
MNCCRKYGAMRRMLLPTTIETHVYRLRQKVEHDDPEAQLIITLEGGYRLKL